MKKTYSITAFIVLVISILSFTSTDNGSSLNTDLLSALRVHGYTGLVQKQLELRLGRKLNKDKIELGRLIFFDKGLGLHQDNSCAGCHSPMFGFGDSQPMAIGVDNNDTVGANRRGPRNQRRTPSAINTAFFKSLMWNNRFRSLSGNPFDNSQGFEFPAPEGDSLFNINYNYVMRNKHLLVAQAHIPFTELPEMAGFTGLSSNAKNMRFSRFEGIYKRMAILQKNGTASLNCTDPDFSVFDDGHGFIVPPPDPHYANTSNFGIRDKVLTQINNNTTYVRLFKKIYPQVAQTGVDFVMVGEVVAEFEFFLTFANAPLDKFAAGNVNAMSQAEKRGALLFFGKANCVSCHAVAGTSNEMFSDFTDHNAGTPQIYPVFGAGTGNVPFSELGCPNKTQTGTLDYGREEFTGNIADRYKFRSSPLRNLQLQSAFFHNGSFRDLKKAIKYHLDPRRNIQSYQPYSNGVPADLKYRPSDMQDVMNTIDPALRNGIRLSETEINDLYLFVRDALYDNDASPDKLRKLIPEKVPSGVKVAFFEPLGSSDLSNKAPVNEAAGKLEVKILSGNPVVNEFSFFINGSEGERSVIRIYDTFSNIKETLREVNNKQTVKAGKNYKAGVYYIEIVQGEKSAIIKFVKL